MVQQTVSISSGGAPQRRGNPHAIEHGGASGNRTGDKGMSGTEDQERLWQSRSEISESTTEQHLDTRPAGWDSWKPPRSGWLRKVLNRDQMYIGFLISLLLFVPPFFLPVCPSLLPFTSLSLGSVGSTIGLHSRRQDSCVCIGSCAVMSLGPGRSTLNITG